MLSLRFYEKNDSKFLLDWAKDPITFTQWCANLFDYPLTETQLQHYYDTYQQKEDSCILTALDENGKPVGHLLVKDIAQGSAYFGFVIVDPNQRDKGRGTELITAAIDYITKTYHISKITLFVFAQNLPAKKCYAACGFQETGYQKEVFPFGTERWSSCHMTWQRERMLPHE